MCTVTFIPLSHGAVLTSNRDEHVQRPTAMRPEVQKLKDFELTYPVDPKSNGTWIVAKSNGDAGVLLNGAFKKHEKLSYYRLSRGVILLTIIKADDPLQCFREINLYQIENFTLILFTNAKLFECRWDGQEKHSIELDHSIPHIWSSVTLYDEPSQKLRLDWFNAWLKSEMDLTPSKIIQFHQNAGSGDSSNSLVMKRDSGVSTFSITSVQCTETTTSLHHYDLKNDVVHQQSLSRTSLFRKKNSLWWRKITIKLFQWEYWPMHVLYAPMYFYWFYLSLKARSLFFFSAANPLRKYAGFALEKKSEVYAHVPAAYYPKTLVCAKGISITDLKMKIDVHELQFPVIAKPDMGERGVKVELIYSFPDLVSYSQLINVDFLVQAYVDYPFEVGIFYYRLPGELNGHISGIVGKELLSVTGDGQSTIRMLLEKESRFLLQLPALSRVYGNELDTVLLPNEHRLLVPYGNHCRGAKFIDLSFKITNELTTVIDALCKHIPEFYFGRLDIKFNSWEELYKGKNFSVIEVNGAASEPTHMYDPNHSILFAWKEIKRHWDLLYLISQKNAAIKGLKLMGTTEGLKMLRAHHSYLKEIKLLSSDADPSAH